MTNFFCFGQRDIDLFKKHGHKIDNYYPVGSLVGGYYKSEVSVPVVKRQYDLCLISQWHKHFFGKIEGDDFKASVSRRVGSAIEDMNVMLLRLLSETNLSIVICPRSNDEAERTYFKNTFGERAEIVACDRKNFSTYRTIEQSRLAIALNSTTLADIIPWGQKTMWCNVTNDEHYQMPEAGICYFSGSDYSAFKTRVFGLLEMPQKEYEMQIKEGAQYINNFDHMNKAHDVIRAAVIKSLSVINP